MLTGQKRKYAIALMSGSSQTKAAIDAGYSEKSARSKGSQLAKDPDVIAFIKKNGCQGHHRKGHWNKQQIHPKLLTPS